MLTMNEVPASQVATTHTRIACELGDLTVVARDRTVVGVYFPHHWHRPDPASFGPYSDVGFDAVREQIGEYLAGERQEFELAVAINGDAYQQRVWSLVGEVAYGETRTYGDLSRRLADGTTPQHVGAAVGRNPLCILVPCHRVVGAGGTLTGYAGGLAAKRFLLDLETEAARRANRLF
jgi:methylated-DNA-[protein]-cysteine S-methyltransferase